MPIKRFQILRCLPFCALLVAAAANLAQASALGSLGAGIAAYQRGEFDEAIRLLGDAISDGGLAPPELGQAYGKRETPIMTEACIGSQGIMPIC
jgi:hypothetical protein